MHYLNQLAYRHIPYHTNVKKTTVAEKDKIRNVALSGCGLCSACMVVNALTTQTLTIEDCVKIAEECEANHSTGTDMAILAPVIANKYNLSYEKTDDLAEAVAHLQKGGQIIVHVGVPEGKSIGLFTKSGHYMTIISTNGKEFCILDPSYTPEKYTIPERIGKVDTSNAPYLYCDIDTLHAETKLNRTKYHLFSRKR